MMVIAKNSQKQAKKGSKIMATCSKPAFCSDNLVCNSLVKPHLIDYSLAELTSVNTSKIYDCRRLPAVKNENIKVDINEATNSTLLEKIAILENNLASIQVALTVIKKEYNFKVITENNQDIINAVMRIDQYSRNPYKGTTYFNQS